MRPLLARRATAGGSGRSGSPPAPGRTRHDEDIDAHQADQGVLNTDSFMSIGVRCGRTDENLTRRQGPTLHYVAWDCINFRLYDAMQAGSKFFQFSKPFIYQPEFALQKFFLD